MSFFSKLFGRKQNDLEYLLTSLKQAQQKKDFLKVCQLYYQVGAKYRSEGIHLKAKLYLGRFDTLAGSQDTIYDKINENWIDNASEWIDEYDQDPSFYVNQVRDRVEELSASLSGHQKIQWNLLSMARFETLFQRISTLPGLELMAKYKKALDVYSQLLYRPIDPSEYETIQSFIEKLYPFTDSLELADTGNRLPVPGGADFEVYDLVGGGILLDIYTLLFDLTELTESKIDSEQVSTEVISGTLLADYYIRTREDDIRDLPAVKAEEKRIFDDYRFVSAGADEEKFYERFESYRKLSLPG